MAWQIYILATGFYAKEEMPESLRAALNAEIEAHLKGYGLTDITVEESITAPLDPSPMEEQN